MGGRFRVGFEVGANIHALVFLIWTVYELLVNLAVISFLLQVKLIAGLKVWLRILIVHRHLLLVMHILLLPWCHQVRIWNWALIMRDLIGLVIVIRLWVVVPHRLVLHGSLLIISLELIMTLIFNKYLLAGLKLTLGVLFAFVPNFLRLIISMVSWSLYLRRIPLKSTLLSLSYVTVIAHWIRLSSLHQIR